MSGAEDRVSPSKLIINQVFGSIGDLGHKTQAAVRYLTESMCSVFFLSMFCP